MSDRNIKDKIKSAITETLVIENKQSIWRAVDKITNIIITEMKRVEEESKIKLLQNYFAWHKEKGYVSHKPSDIDEFINYT